MKRIELTIRGDAVPMGRPRTAVIKGHARIYQPQKSQEYKAYVRMVVSEYMREHGIPTLDDGVSIYLLFKMAVPKSFTKKKRVSALEGNTRPTKKPDLDNLAKTILDALNGIAYRDDSQIVRLSLEKTYSEESEVEIFICDVDYKGEN